MTHLLVTNDYPPKIGGIQSYLYELWRRIPAERFAVMTIDQSGATESDEQSGQHIVRVRTPMLLPTPNVRNRIRSLAAEVGASLVILDPALPIGLIGPSLGIPYGVVLHGAEVTVPSRLPLVSRALRKVITGASLVIAAGGYPASEARLLCGADMPETIIVPPGVDIERFQPIGVEQRNVVRERFGVRQDA